MSLKLFQELKFKVEKVEKFVLDPILTNDLFLFCNRNIKSVKEIR